MKSKSIRTVNEVSRCYTYYLEQKINKIYSQMTNEDVSIEDMRRNIKSYIYPSLYSFYSKKSGKLTYTKKKWFIEQLNSSKTKKQIYFLCRNSIRKARETEAR